MREVISGGPSVIVFALVRNAPVSDCMLDLVVSLLASMLSALLRLGLVLLHWRNA